MPDITTDLEKIPSSTKAMIEHLLPELSPLELKHLAESAESNIHTRRLIPEPSLVELQTEHKQQQLITQQEQRLKQHQTRQIVEQQQMQTVVNEAMVALQQAAGNVMQTANQANQSGIGAAANAVSAMQRVNQILSTANPRVQSGARMLMPGLKKMFSLVEKMDNVNQQLKALTLQHPSLQNPVFQNNLAQNSSLLEKSNEALRPLANYFVKTRQGEIDAAAVMKKAYQQSSQIPRLTAAEGTIIEKELEKDLQVNLLKDKPIDKQLQHEIITEKEKTIEQHLSPEDQHEDILRKLKELEEEIGNKRHTPFSTSPSRGE
jgi:hypothetical protein